ncbi:nuclease-related domain-containing protein [Virgibacillus ainsalahensis]
MDIYSNYAAGYHGEKMADYTISIYPHKNSFIYRDLRLQNGPYFFQMDNLILTDRFILIIEVKHMGGELEYNSDSQQLVQKRGVKKRGYKSPIYQAETQKFHLLSWLQTFELPSIPIETLAVLSNPSTVLENDQDNPSFFDKFVMLEALPEKIHYLYEKYQSKILDRNMMMKLHKCLLKGDIPHKPNLIKQYNIKEKHIVKGIPCTECQHHPMTRSGKKWVCPKCKHIDFHAHERVLLDYFLLYKPTITNRECRNFLHIESPKTAYYLLKSMKLEYTGRNSARKYHAPSLENFPQDSLIPIEQKSIFDN